MCDALSDKNSVDLRNLTTLVAKSYLSYTISSSNIYQVTTVLTIFFISLFATIFHCLLPRSDLHEIKRKSNLLYFSYRIRYDRSNIVIR